VLLVIDGTDSPGLLRACDINKSSSFVNFRAESSLNTAVEIYFSKREIS
jgi:hypothetical protein